MENRSTPLPIDLYSPEREKYKAPLVLIHGLWSASACWMPWATHFANLGWECRAVNLRGRQGDNAAAELKRLTFADCVDDVRQVIRAAPFPPVIVAHDLGASIALEAAAGEKASALVLVAPLAPERELPRAVKLLRLKYRPLLFLRRPFRLEESDFRNLWLDPGARDEGAADCLVADAPALVNAFFSRVDFAGGKTNFPLLVAAAREDRIVSPAAQKALAQRLGADFREYTGGHWLIGADGGEEIARDLHRWIVQEIGGEIILEPPPAPPIS
jgi:pimeloyl-ACP methyl ester carboxylesterase